MLLNITASNVRATATVHLSDQPATSGQGCSDWFVVTPGYSPSVVQRSAAVVP
jgi:hypothetical protein